MRIEDVSRELKVTPKPNNSKVVDGYRFIPVTILDVAGLVPGAHEGKGLGNQFLNDLSSASALIHVVDISGSTDSEGNPVKTGEHDPLEDIEFLEKEIDYWLAGILEKNWGKIERKVAMSHAKLSELLFEQLSGLKISENDITRALKKAELNPEKAREWEKESLFKLAIELRKESKPIIIAANKIDVPGAEENLKRAKEKFPEYKIIPCCAEAELALSRAAEHGLIKYKPGDSDFELLNEMDDKQKKALEFIRENILKKYNGTGIQNVINKAVFDLLKRIAVYPVEDENKYSDHNGNVLPDAYLLPQGSKVIDLAYAVHTDIGKNFIAAIDAKTKKKVGKDVELKNKDVIKIFAKG